MESTSRISGMLENARDLTLDVARDLGGLRKQPLQRLPTAQLRKLLDSRNDREVLDGLRRIIAYSAKASPNDPPLLFSSVVKQVANPSLHIKKLVYIYLLQYAEAEPDTALLAINTIQKSLSAQDPHLRALALRVMSGIRVPVISQIVGLGIKKGVGDMSPLVRKAAALAIPKCWRMDPSQSALLLEYLETLLGDKQYFVVGAAVNAFLEMCPERLDLIHKHYRSLVRKLVDMDEWGQLATLRLMARYARSCFPRKWRKIKKGNLGASAGTANFYGEEETPAKEESSDVEEVQVLDPDLELLLKQAQSLLSSRSSAVVISVARLYLYLTSPSHHNYLDTTVGPLVALLRTSPSIKQVALRDILEVATIRPQPFVRYTTHFLVKPTTDAPQIWQLKLEILTLLFPQAPPHVQSLILNELRHFCTLTSTSDAGRSLAREAVRAIGRCAQTSAGGDPTASHCMKLLLTQVSDFASSPELVAEALTVVRHLIQADPSRHNVTIIRLAKNLDTMTSPQARASIIWLVGEFAGYDQGRGNIAADVLRILIKSFAEEAEVAKLQIVLLAAKVYLHHINNRQAPDAEAELGQNTKNGYESLMENEKPKSALDLPVENEWSETGDSQETKDNAEQSSTGTAAPTNNEHGPIPKLWDHVLLLVRYDTSYDLRDRTRYLRALLNDTRAVQLANLLLLAPKPQPRSGGSTGLARFDKAASGTSKDDLSDDAFGSLPFTLGTSSLQLGSSTIGGVDGGTSGLPGYEPLPDWVAEGQEPDPSLRDQVSPGESSDYARGAVGSAASRLDSSSTVRIGHVGNTRPVGKVGTDRGAVGAKTLDDWLDEDEQKPEGDEEDEESEEETSEEEESTEEESTEEEESEEEEEEDDSEAGEQSRTLLPAAKRTHGT